MRRSDDTTPFGHPLEPAWHAFRLGCARERAEAYDPAAFDACMTAHVAVFRDRARDIPDDKVLVAGAVDTTTNFVEHPDLVAQRLERFTAIVRRDRVIAGSDCGFGTFAGFGSVDPEIAWAKLATLKEGARCAG